MSRGSRRTSVVAAAVPSGGVFLRGSRRPPGDGQSVEAVDDRRAFPSLVSVRLISRRSKLIETIAYCLGKALREYALLSHLHRRIFPRKLSNLFRIKRSGILPQISPARCFERLGA